MSDLISRSTAMENYCNALCPKLQKGEYCNDCIVKAWLNNQPIAYDIDNVVEELESFAKLAEDRWTNGTSKHAYQEHKCWVKAIEIVKAGGGEYNDGWIPCSERLPEIDGNTSDTVLVCGSNGFLYMAFWCDDLQWRFCECGMAKEPVLWTEIVAWQPLPEPFKERD